jgi:threonine/homoserine/homoserine lactone efflux protein
MERRPRTFWVMRERYRRAAGVVTVAGIVAGLAIVAYLAPRGGGLLLQRAFIVQAALIVAASALLPWLLVRLMWRIERRRRREEWN